MPCLDVIMIAFFPEKYRVKGNISNTKLEKGDHYYIPTRQKDKDLFSLSPFFPAATAPFPKSGASYFRFAHFNTFALYYLRAWHRLQARGLPSHIWRSTPTRTKSMLLSTSRMARSCSPLT